MKLNEVSAPKEKLPIYRNDVAIIDETLTNMDDYLNTLPKYQAGCHVKGHFYVGSGPRVMNIKKLSSCPTRVDKEFAIVGCRKMTSLVGCPQVVGEFVLSGLLKLKNIDCLPTIGYGVGIYDCPELKTFPQFQKILDGHVSIRNSGFVNLKGLPKRCDHLHIRDCDNLETLDGLPEEITSQFILNNLIRLKNIKAMWYLRMKNWDKVGLHDQIGDELKEAIDIMVHYRKSNERNYFVVIKDARSKGLEDYFK